MELGIEYLTVTEKLLKIYEDLDKIKNAAISKTTETINNLTCNVYNVAGIITVKTSGTGFHIIEFDKEHYIEHIYMGDGMNGSPILVGPSSDRWDNSTSKILDDFLQNEEQANSKYIGKILMINELVKK